MIRRRRRPPVFTAAHEFCVRWLRRHAPYPVHVPHRELVEVFETYDREAGDHAEHGDIDRYVRRLCKEALELGWPVSSNLTGYTWAWAPDVEPDARLLRQRARLEQKHDRRGRAIALYRQEKQLAVAQEEQAKRDARERIPVQAEPLPPEAAWGQGTLFA